MLFQYVMGENDLAVIIPEKEIEKRVSSLQAKLGALSLIRVILFFLYAAALKWGNKSPRLKT
jgi:hypothetical protein